MRAALYARVSTALKYEKQDPATQLLPLREFCAHRGWEIYGEYVDDISAVKFRPEYNSMLSEARKGKLDVIVVVKLDRMFRSMEEFARVISELNHRNVRFVCADQNIDTDKRSPGGILLMNILAAVAEFERALISERVRAGIARARAQGKPHGGHKRKKQIDIEQARELQAKGYSMTRIGALLGCNRNIVARELTVFS
jgi:DNA invertase Pin-like site-specific DNA recombinase